MPRTRLPNRHAAACITAALAACAGTPSGSVDAFATAAAFVRTIPDTLRTRGPLGWVELADPHDFRMFSDGAEKFADADALRAAMTAFAPQVRSMELHWDSHVEPIGDDRAWFAAIYDEVFQHTDGTTARFAGCVTGLLRRADGNWRITRLHWSQPR